MALNFLNDGYFAGKVGIRTQSPTGVLHIKTTDDSTFWLAKIEADGTTQNALLATTDTTSGTGVRFDLGGQTGSFTVLNSGNVGIGTISPVSPLTVKSNSVSSGESGIVIQANGNTNSIIKLGERGGDGGRFEMLDANVTKIALYTDGTSNYINAGNVGIGTTSPAQKFVVANATNGQGIEIVPGTSGIIQSYDRGTSAYIPLYLDTSLLGLRSTGYIALNTGSGFSEAMRIDSSGNVGIGITNPVAYGKFVVQGTGNLINANASSGAATFQLYEGGQGRFAITTLNGSAGAKFLIAGNEKMRIDSNGNVGIGTTSPGQKLHVVSTTNDNATANTVKISHSRSDTDFPTNALYIDMNLSGADTTTADRTNRGIFVDIDSTANGDAANEYRIRGVNSDVRFSGFSDAVQAGYFYAESNNNTVKTAQLIGVYGNSVHDSSTTTGGVSNMYGVYGMSDIQDLGDVDTAFGGFFQVNIGGARGNANIGITKGVEGQINIDKATTIDYGTMSAVSAIIDNNEGAVPNFGNQFLFRGDYQGDKGANAYGIYCEGDKHYLQGNLGISTSGPTQALHVVGNARVTGAYYDSNNSPGTANQVLVSTATGTDWVDGSGSSIIGGPYLPLSAGSSYPLTGNLILDDGSGSSPSIVFKNANDNTWSIFNGSQGVLNITEGTTDRLQFAAGGNATFAGDVQAPGIYVGATNTSFDFYNNGTSYLNGAVTVDAAFTQSGGAASSFSGLVSGITPVNAANFVTKAYVDGSSGGTGPFLPLAGGTLTGNLILDGAQIFIDTDTAGNSLTWRESDSSIVAGQLRGYGNRGDIYLYDSGVKKTELSSQADSFIPALHIGGTSAATGGVLQTTGNVNIDGSADISATVTATTFSGDLNGTINTVTTAVTQANAVDNETVATTAYVNNKIGLIPAGLVFQGTWNASTNTPTLTSGSGTTGNFYIVSVAGSTNLDGITDWKVGDWAVFIEQGASDQWEKIDNSSVLDGIGTGNQSAKWAGSGTSNTLTNGSIEDEGTILNAIRINSTTTTTKNYIGMGMDSTNNQRLSLAEADSNGSHIRMVNSRSGGGYFVVGVGDTNSSSNIVPPGGMFFYNGVTRMVINSSGNVGIGTTSPSAELDVDGVIRSRGGTYAADIDTKTDVGLIIPENDFIYTADGSSYLRKLIGKTSDIITIGEAGTSLIDGINLVPGTSGGYVQIFNNSSIAAKFVDGKLGIGTTSPNGKLSFENAIETRKIVLYETANNDFQFYGLGIEANKLVYTTASNSDDHVFFSGVNATTRNELMRIEGGGNVGIGTTSPDSKLDVTGGDITVNTAATGFMNFKYGSAGSEVSRGTITTDGVDLKINSVADLLLLPSGTNKVGIGTTSPTYKLSVSGGIEAGGLVTYSKVAGSLSTTGYAVAGLTAGFNGASAGFEFKCYGSNSKYQRIVYSCHCSGTTWVPGKVIDEGTNDLDVVASANGATITFTFKARSSTQNFSPRIVIQATGHSINSTYA